MRAQIPAFLLVLAALVACRKDPPPAPIDPGQAPPVVLFGASLYANYCATCHGARGEGYAADNAPSLISVTFRETASEPFLRTAIELGRPGTAMAGFARRIGGPLAEGDVEALVRYLRFGAPPAPALDERPVQGDAARGLATYEANCRSCHGTPTQRANAVHLFNPALLASASNGYLRDAIARGRPGTRMEAFAQKLPASDREEVLAYLRSQAQAVPPAPVAPWVPPAKAEAPHAHPGDQARPPPPPNAPPRLPITGPVVVNPKGKQAEFTLREGLYASVAQVGQALKEGRRLVFVDARTPSDYLRMHIEGAISVPYYDMVDLAQIPNDGTWVIAYCACPHHVSGIVVDELRKRGYPHAAVLDEGIFFWQQQGFPVVAAEGQLPVAAPPPPAAGPQ